MLKLTEISSKFRPVMFTIMKEISVKSSCEIYLTYVINVKCIVETNFSPIFRCFVPFSYPGFLLLFLDLRRREAGLQSDTVSPKNHTTEILEYRITFRVCRSRLKGHKIHIYNVDTKDTTQQMACKIVTW